MLESRYHAQGRDILHADAGDMPVPTCFQYALSSKREMIMADCR